MSEHKTREPVDLNCKSITQIHKETGLTRTTLQRFAHMKGSGAFFTPGKGKFYFNVRKFQEFLEAGRY